VTLASYVITVHGQKCDIVVPMHVFVYLCHIVTTVSHIYTHQAEVSVSRIMIGTLLEHKAVFMTNFTIFPQVESESLNRRSDIVGLP
jgi:hypothetical protein